MTRYVSVSEMGDFLACQWRWYAKWVLNRVPRRYSSALMLGTAVHNIFAAYFANHTPLEEAFEAAHAELIKDATRRYADPDRAFAAAFAAKDLLRFKPQVVGLKLRYPIEEVRAVEEAFELPGYTPKMQWAFERHPVYGMPERYVLRGRPDLVVVVGGLLYHVQHKTVAIGKPIDAYCKVLQRSMHEGLYGYYLANTHPEQYGGTIVNLVRKGVASAKTPAESLGFQTMLKVDEFDRQRAYLRAVAILREMDRALYIGSTQGHNALIDNPGMDAGQYGNSLDGYLPVLQGRASLSDERYFIPREETYAEPEAA